MDPVSLLIFIFLLFTLIFFTCSEFPLMSIPEHKVEAFAKKNRFWAFYLKKIKQKNESLLIVNLIWTTFITIALSSIGTLVALGISKKMAIPEETGATIAVLLVSWIVLIFWEITPKILAVRYAENIAFFVAPIYRFFMILLFPVIFVTELFVKILNLITLSKWDLHSQKMTSEEFEAFIDMWHEKWAVESDEHKKIKWVLDLWDTLAESVMTPRVQMDSVSIDTTVDMLCEYLLIHSHSRIPIYEWTIDNIDYVITFKQAFKLKESGRWPKKLRELTLDKIIKIPLTQPIDKVFETLQKSRKHIALVLDEHWWVEWIITLEDIIEEVFWDIKDETDKEDVYLKSLPDWRLLVSGNTLIDDIIEEFKIEDLSDIWLSWDFIWENLSYIITSVLERFPENWECFELSWKHKSLKINVKNILNWKIGQVLLEKV